MRVWIGTHMLSFFVNMKIIYIFITPLIFIRYMIFQIGTGISILSNPFYFCQSSFRLITREIELNEVK